MKKPGLKKLALSKQTLRKLTEDELRKPAGGRPLPTAECFVPTRPPFYCYEP